MITSNASVRFFGGACGFLRIACMLLPVCLPAVAAQQDRPLDPIAAGLEPDRLVVYRTIGSLELKLHVFEPANHRPTDRRSAFVIIHGGGWTSGNARRGYPFADYFRRQGMLAISIDYRLLNRPPGTTVLDCVRDGRSAVRYIREHAEQLGVDPQLIVVAGCSAGGHVAAGTAMFDSVDDVDEPPGGNRISPSPNALVLYYPVIDTSVAGYGQKKAGAEWRRISPLHQVRPGLPPTIVFHGDADTVTPYVGAVSFRDAMQKSGNDCRLVSHPGGVHGYLIFDLKLFEQSLEETREFLQTKGFLPASALPGDALHVRPSAP